MQTTDPGLLFQTTAQIVADSNKALKRKAAKAVGDPIELSGKIIEFIVVNNDAYVAESGWQARRVSLETGKTLRLYKGHKGPVTCVAVSQTIANRRSILYTGSWDKTIRVWDAASGEQLYILSGHSDFVKSLAVVGERLISTSSDKTIRVWNISSLDSGETPLCVQTLKQHTRPVDCAAVADVEEKAGWTTVVWTGDSMGIIHEWNFKDNTLVHRREIPGHETSVAELHPVEDGLWSVSMDKTAIFHERESGDRLLIPHQAYVHCVLPVPSEVSSRSLVITGGDDEDIRVWEIQGDPDAATNISTVQAHSAPVTCIRLWKTRKTEASSSNWIIVSGSLDGTLRRWTLGDLLHPVPLNFTPASHEPNSEMTEEEERELAELMEDDD